MYETYGTQDHYSYSMTAAICLCLSDCPYCVISPADLSVLHNDSYNYNANCVVVEEFSE